MSEKTPINKGNFDDLESLERKQRFEQYRGEGWEEEYREYRDNWTKYAKEQFVAEWPLLVDIELSTICNLKCPMCYTLTEDFKSKVPTKLMDEALYKSIIDEIAGNVPAIRLSLRGEPTLHPRFIEFIKYAKDKGIKEVSFLTNGSKLDDEYIEKIILAGADWITVSIDGVDEQYEAIRYPMKFSGILNSMKRFKEIKDRIGVHKPVIKIQGIWPAVRRNVKKYYDTFEPYVDLIAFNTLIDYLKNDENIIYEDEFSCPMIYQRIVVASDGMVLSCSMDESNSFVVGDRNCESIHEIWHGKKFNEIREAHKTAQGFMCYSKCRECEQPRKLEEVERVKLYDREIVIRNYIGRTQEIGK